MKKNTQKKQEEYTPRPFIVESKWKEGSADKRWKFFKAFKSEPAAEEAVITALGKINFMAYRLVIQGQEKWVK